MKFTKHVIYISLFGILYLIVAFSSFWHACSFFGLANTSWMSIILALAFEVGQAAVLFSLLTSEKDRGRIMPWVLMTMFTLVQVVGNVFSSYKYIITNSVENLRYFKEPIFIWTSLPDDQATVIVTYVVGAILPVAALLLTSMITNYLTDIENSKNIGLSANDEKAALIHQINYLQTENQTLEEKLNKLENDKETFKTQEAPQEEYKKEKPDEGVINNEETSKESINEEPMDEEPVDEELVDEELEKINELVDEEPIDKDPVDEELVDEESIKEEPEKTIESVDESINEKPVDEELIDNELETTNLSKESEVEYNNETDEENMEVDDKNLRMAAALIGGNVPNKQRVNKESHFINNK